MKFSFFSRNKIWSKNLNPIIEKLKPPIQKFFRIDRAGQLQKMERDIAKGARIKAMFESGGYNDQIDEFVDKFLNDLMRLANDIQSGRIRPEILQLQIAEILGRLENFEWLKNRVLTYEKDKEQYEERKKDMERQEKIRSHQAEFAR